MLSRDRRAPSRYPQKGEINAHGVLTLYVWPSSDVYPDDGLFVSRHSIGVAHPYKKKLRLNGLACRTKRGYPS